MISKLQATTKCICENMPTRLCILPKPQPLDWNSPSWFSKWYIDRVWRKSLILYKTNVLYRFEVLAPSPDKYCWEVNVNKNEWDLCTYRANQYNSAAAGSNVRTKFRKVTTCLLTAASSNLKTHQRPHRHQRVTLYLHCIQSISLHSHNPLVHH